jgi:hypothetical protein
MPHVYHVDVQSGAGTATQAVQVHDDDHHSTWKDTRDFAAFLANALAISAAAVKGWRWVKKL